MKTTPLRPHKVLGKTSPDGELHALAFTTGQFADIVFSCTNVKFIENKDALTIAYEYHLHDVPHHLKDFDKELLEKEIQSYFDKANNLKADLLRVEGIILYLQNKIKELENSNLTNS